MILILDNIRSAYNVGSIMRTAEFFGIETIYCCGITPDTKEKNVLKTSLGTEHKLQIIKYAGATVRLVKKIKKEGYEILALEQDARSIDLQKFNIKKDKQYALIVGNEIKGVSKSILGSADSILEIKGQGHKESLNVAMATAIVVAQLMQ